MEKGLSCLKGGAGVGTFPSLRTPYASEASLCPTIDQRELRAEGNHLIIVMPFVNFGSFASLLESCKSLID